MQWNEEPRYPTVPIERRNQLLDQALADRLSRRGRRLEFYTEINAVVVRGRPVNHPLHAILTLFTRVWFIVWLMLIGFGGEERELVFVDQYGNVGVQRLH